jgi:hypothetical protein
MRDEGVLSRLDRNRSTSAGARANPVRPLGAWERARRIAVPVWLLVSAINFAVWATVCICTASWDMPWWLYGFGGGGVIVAALALAERGGRPRVRNSPRADW